VTPSSTVLDEQHLRRRPFRVVCVSCVLTACYVIFDGVGLIHILTSYILLAKVSNCTCQCEWIILVKSLDNVKYLHDNYITGQFVPNESYDNLTTISG
jgi:hypothetical protein